MKKLIATILCVVMVISLLPMSAFAASGTLVREEALAKELKALGIFKGVSETDFALDRAPTRTEALVMLIRVLGRESDALSKGGRHPFLDVPQWADKYVGYAYENKLTNGVSATKFGSNSIASASMYLTFVLRALGYSDSNGDFTWDNPFALARQTGIMSGNPDVMNFLRADVVLVSYAALEAQIKGTRKTLAQKLIEAGVFTAEAYDRYYNLSEFENEGKNKELTAEEIYAKCSPAVFFIEVYDEAGKPLGTGSGFFIKSDGTAVTNYHVIDGAAKAKILRSDNGKVYTVARVHDFSEEEDWAVIKIDGDTFPYLEIEKNEPVRGGQTVYAIGSPKGLDNTISEGLISNLNRVVDGVSCYQISVPISHGSSGGALINKSGNVIGITSGGFVGGENLNYALPISIIEGYKEKDPHDHTGQFENSHLTVGEVELEGVPRADAARELLHRWIANNSNVTLGDMLAYGGTFEDDGGRESVVIAYDPAETLFYIIGQYEFDGSDSFAVVLTFSPYGDDVFAEYEYYPKGWNSADVMEERTFSKYDFSQDFEFEFKQAIFVDERELHQNNAASLVLDCLWFVDDIMRRNLTGYGIRGITDLGFVYFR